MNKTYQPVRRWSLFWPLLLIVAGAILFLNATGTIKGTAWDMVYRFWPILFIIGGLDGIFRRQAVVFSTFELGVALAYQLSLLGLITGIDWYIAIRFWPLILIAIALDILIGDRTLWASLVALVAGVVLLVVFGLATNHLANTRPLVYQNVNQPLEAATSADISLSPALGRLSITGGAAKSDLINARVTTVKNFPLNPSYQVKDGKGTYTLDIQGAYSVIYPDRNFNDPSIPVLDCRLTSAIPYDLQVAVGVGDVTANLTGTHPDNVKVNVDIGQEILTLPASETYYVTAKNSIGTLVVYVPRGKPVSIQLKTGLTVTHLPDDFNREGDTAYSPGYKGGTNVIDLTLEQDIGSLDVRYLQ